mmetsp:Transcript_1674/g.4043  ORF Transcript_1674/g.4043 Transcript_1674/m.4043 type:complete len:114 (-) Transcript_1674:1374-1715(-)
MLLRGRVEASTTSNFHSIVDLTLVSFIVSFDAVHTNTKIRDLLCFVRAGNKLRLTSFITRHGKTDRLHSFRSSSPPTPINDAFSGSALCSLDLQRHVGLIWGWSQNHQARDGY